MTIWQKTPGQRCEGNLPQFRPSRR